MAIAIFIVISQVQYGPDIEKVAENFKPLMLNVTSCRTIDDTDKLDMVETVPKADRNKYEKDESPMQLSMDDLNTWEELQAKAQGIRRLVTKKKRALTLLNHTYHSRFMYLWPAPALFLAHGRRAPRPPPPSPARHQAQSPAAPALFQVHGCWAPRPPPPGPARHPRTPPALVSGPHPPRRHASSKHRGRARSN
jgi:hypothetical protein